MINLRINELCEQNDINMSQLQRGTGLTLGMVRRYWKNEVDSVSLKALDAILACIRKKNDSVQFIDLFNANITQA